MQDKFKEPFFLTFCPRSVKLQLDNDLIIVRISETGKALFSISTNIKTVTGLAGSFDKSTCAIWLNMLSYILR